MKLKGLFSGNSEDQIPFDKVAATLTHRCPGGLQSIVRGGKKEVDFCIRLRLNVNLKNKTRGPSCISSLTVPVNQILLTLTPRQTFFLIKEDSSEGPDRFLKYQTPVITSSRDTDRFLNPVSSPTFSTCKGLPVSHRTKKRNDLIFHGQQGHWQTPSFIGLGKQGVHLNLQLAC